MHDNDAPEELNRDNAHAEVSAYAKKGFKVICYAFCEISKATWEEAIGDAAEDDDRNAVFREKLTEGHFGFRLLATFALKDGLRPTAASAVEYARQEAGLMVRLISNDHVETAITIARKAGILNADEEQS